MKEKLGIFSIMLLGVNAIIGSGIFLIPNKVAAIVSNASIWVILFDAFLVLCLALCFAEMSARFKKNGGAYLYARAAFGEFLGFEVGLMKWIVSISSWAALSVALATVFGKVFPALDSEVIRPFLAVFFIILLVIVNIKGLNMTKIVNNTLTISKLVPLFIFIVIGIFFLNLENIKIASPFNIEVSKFSSAILLMFYAFTGFESLSIAAGEMENPQKNLPRVITAVIVFVSTFYILIQMVATSALGNELASTSSPLASAFGQMVGSWGEQFILIGSLISIGGINVAVSFFTPRLAQALGEDGYLPEQLGKRNSNGTPVNAILISALLAIPLALSGSFTQIAAINVIVRFGQYIPTCLAVLVMRKKDGPAPGFTIPAGPIIPLIAVAASIWVLFHTPSNKLLIGFGAVLLGSPLYLLVKKQQKNNG